MIVRAVLVGLVVVSACGGGGAPTVEAEAVARCLDQEFGSDGWSTIPLSDRALAVHAVDLGDNSVQIFIEPDSDGVAAEIAEIREAEDTVGNTAPADRVILRERGNVLVSWANEPAEEHRAAIERCAGVA